ncbi:glycosyl transferase family 2 [Calothrix sp. 336/3]|nr:glycosyl transferase family 2 [Calothrix sp. 336/3]
MKRGKVSVGLVGTGYAAKLRAEALLNDRRSHLVAIVGHHPVKTADFAQEYECIVVNSWQELVTRDDLDVIFISTVNRDHGAIAKAALTHGKHVVIEYPLSLDVEEASEIVTLARSQNLLLHVEHIEILTGTHQALQKYLPELGQVFYVRYNTINPQHPAPRKWSYNHELFGFPMIAAVSRLHRLIDLFGEVLTVNCHYRFWQTEPDYYQSCFCVTQLNFHNGLLGQVIYGKGETLWQAERKFEVHGEKGGLIFEVNSGKLIHDGETISIDVGSRRGMFLKDTKMVLDCLFDGTPLYITPEQSLYTLKVADAARRSAETGLTAVVENRSQLILN